MVNNVEGLFKLGENIGTVVKAMVHSTGSLAGSFQKPQNAEDIEQTNTKLTNASA